jgi:uncharacterized protein with PIN domain
MAVFSGVDASKPGTPAWDEVVQISLLLPASRAEALVALSRRTSQSVGQILRRLIDEALAAEEL